MIYILYGKDKSMVSMKLDAIKKRHHIEENVNVYDAQPMIYLLFYRI